MPQMLRGYRVLDFGRYISGPFCAAMLADMGADVIRVEPVLGADDRHVMPINDEGDGALYLQTNRGKRSLAINIDKQGAREVIERLIRSSDVVIANLPPAALKKIGLDYASLRAIREDIILTSISAYGSVGAYRNAIGFDGTGQALSGAIALTGHPDQPFRSAVSYVDYGTALSAAYGTMAALLQRERTGRGDHVQASLLGTALTITNPMLIEEATGARSRTATGNRSPIAGPSDMFATSDGWIMIQVIGQAMFARWAELVGAQSLVDDPRFIDDIRRGENGELLSLRTAEWTRGRTTIECLGLLREARLPASPVLGPAQTLAAPEVVEGEFLRFQRHPRLSRPVPIVEPPVRFESAGAFQPGLAPDLGADSSALLSELGFSRGDIAALRLAQAI